MGWESYFNLLVGVVRDSSYAGQSMTDVFILKRLILVLGEGGKVRV